MIVSVIKAKSKRRFAPLSWIIRKNQKTKWSHYAIEYGENIMSDAKRKGIRRLHRTEWLKGYKVVDVVTINLPCTAAELNKWVSDKLGTKYSFFQLIGIGLITCGIIKRNPFGKNNKYLVCHEYILIMLQEFLKIDIGDSDDYDFKKADVLIDRYRL